MGMNRPLVSCASYQGTVREAIVAWKEQGRLDLERPLADCLARSVLRCVEVAVSTVNAPDEDHPEQPNARTGQMITLVPVPSSRAAVRARGEDVLARLADRTARSLADRGADRGAGRARGSARSAGNLSAADGDPGGSSTHAAPSFRVASVRALSQVRGVRDQAGLTAGQRAVNTSGRIRIRRSTEWSWRLRRCLGQPWPAPLGAVVLVDDIVTTGASLAAAATALQAAGIPVLGAATVAWTPRRRVGTFASDSPTLRTVGVSNPGLAWRARPDERGEAPRG